MVGNVAAGSPILAEECIEDYLTFDTGGRPGRVFCPAGPGRVHAERRHPARRPGGSSPASPLRSNGEIVVALIDDEATVKRLSLKSGQVWLLPENEAYSAH